MYKLPNAFYQTSTPGQTLNFEKSVANVFMTCMWRNNDHCAIWTVMQFQLSHSVWPQHFVVLWYKIFGMCGNICWHVCTAAQSWSRFPWTRSTSTVSFAGNNEFSFTCAWRVMPLFSSNCCFIPGVPNFSLTMYPFSISTDEHVQYP